MPPRLHGLALSALPAAGARLSEFGTPVLAVHEDAMAHNEATVFAWAAERGLRLAPHGKTTMAPALWQRLIDAGAWGITVATPWQAEVAIEAGVERVLIANAVTDVASARRLGAHLAADPTRRILVWADAVVTVDILAEGLADAVRPLDVLVELGGAHGRTGARTVTQGEDIARAIAAAPGLRLAGVAGYEGPFGPDRGSSSVAAVDAYLERMTELFGRIRPLVDRAAPPIISAGGSAWPDRVAAVFAPLAAEAEVVLRSGAFQIHDDGFYSRMAPFGSVVDGPPLRAAMHAWARVVSQPEEGLALLDAGRRDVPFDIDLPVPQGVAGEVTALNDQHAFLRTARAETVEVGQVVRLGLSHPCTAFDKWRVIPVIDDPDADDPLVIGAVATCF